MTYITTKHPDGMVQGKVNKLKGMALEKAVSDLVKRKYEAKDLTGQEDSLSGIQEKASKELEDLLQVKSTFFIKDASGESTNFYPTQSAQFDHENYLLDLSEFTYPCELRAKTGNKNASLGYKGCKSCGYCVPQEFCWKCGGAVFEDRFMVLKKIKELYDSDKAETLYHTKFRNEDASRIRRNLMDTSEEFCFRVKLIFESPWNDGRTEIRSDYSSQGYNDYCTCYSPDRESHTHADRSACPNCSSSFKILRPSFNFEEQEVVGESLDKSELREKLVENDLVTQDSANRSLHRKRLDSWLIDTDSSELFISESKNYEKTALGHSDVSQVLSYVDAVRKIGFVKPKVVNLIYNGSAVTEAESRLEKLDSSVDFDMNIVEIESFCEDVGMYIESVTVGRDEDMELSSDGDFRVSVSYSSEPVDNPLVILPEDDSE